MPKYPKVIVNEFEISKEQGKTNKKKFPFTEEELLIDLDSSQSENVAIPTQSELNY